MPTCWHVRRPFVWRSDTCQALRRACRDTHRVTGPLVAHNRFDPREAEVENPAPRTGRIFIASSAEMADHRDAFDLYIRQRNDRWVRRGLLLQPVRWEHGFIDAMDAERLQGTYNAALETCDVFVLLCRHKVGKYTAEEFERAFGRFREAGRPRVYTYFHDTSVQQSKLDRAEQMSLWAFQDRLTELGHFRTAYENVDKLCLHFGEQLELLDDAGAFGPAPQPADTPPSPATRPTDLVPYLTRRAAHWREAAAGRLDRRFVDLTLMFDHGLDFDGPRHEAQGRYDLLADLLAARPDVGAWVLVGVPGSGKSTVMQHHEMATADAALQQLATPDHDPGGPAPEVCLWHRLSEYDATQSPAPADWLALPTRWPRDLPPLDALRRVARVRFLLDGLNEIKAPDRARQLQAVERWTEWAAAESARGDGLAPIFSVRTLDQSPMSTSGFEVRQVTLSLWDEPRIEAYCAARLGADNTLWPTLAGDAKLLELSQLPFNLWAQCELFRALERPARDRAELLGGLFWQMLVRRAGDPALKAPGLLGAQAWQRLADGGWKRMLRALPDRHGYLVPWLDETLQRLHRAGRQVSVTQADLLAGLQPGPGTATPEQWLYAVRSLQLIDEDGYHQYTGEPLLRCTHQLWQEYFAARGIRHGAATQPERLPGFQPPPLPDLEQTVQQLGVQEPLPGPDPTHWEEPVKLAVQLVEDPAPWISVLQPQNLALAGRAAVACRDRLDAPALDRLRQALLARSRDPATDLRLRIEAALVLGELGDPRYEERQGPHGRYLWPRHWVTVPAGTYRIGDNQSPHDNEKPETDVVLQAFEMAFAPVTNAEYRCFVDADGYEDERWWVGETARRWRKEGERNEAEIEHWRAQLAEIRRDVEAWIDARPGMTDAVQEQVRGLSRQSEVEHEAMLDDRFGARPYDRPAEWRNPSLNAPTQPVVGLCLFEARAYSAWLHAQSGDPVRLPTEAEWEAAARGPGRHRWPWGDTAPERWAVNADPAHLRRTSSVGVFPAGDRPDGLTDLSGNVWEWTTSGYTDRLETAPLTKEPLEIMARRVVRGGSWFSTPADCRPSYRLRYPPVLRYAILGFRLVSSCPIPEP